MGISTFLPGIVLLGIVIFVHELGHFLAAKWRRVTVLKFSLGMGPELVGFTRGGTRYCLSWIPLGGFVQMAGDQLNEDGSMPEGGPEQFLTHPWYGRVIIAVAGPGANLVTAFVVMVITFLVGVHQPDWPNRLGPLPESSPAYAAGLREGDTFTSFAGKPTLTWHDLENASIGINDKAPVTFQLRRGGEPIVLTIPARQTKSVLGELQPPPPPVPPLEPGDCLTREEFDEVVRLHTQGRSALLHRDGVHGRLRATPSPRSPRRSGAAPTSPYRSASSVTTSRSTSPSRPCEWTGRARAR